MHSGERESWLNIIGVEDLDIHMANVGQAKANAEIKKEMFKDYPLRDNSKLLIAGCGTAQFCEYMSPEELGKGIELTFSDINASFLDKCKERLAKYPCINYVTVEDDIESTKLKGSYDGLLIALVLQHVEWKKALTSMVSLNPMRLYLIIQEQDPSQHTLTRSRNDLTPAWQKYGEIAHPVLVPKDQLIDFIDKKGYNLIKTYKREVPNNKVMVGYVFEKITS